MSVQSGIASAFVAVLQDNGNPIELPAGSSFSWSTDDATDTIVPGGGVGTPTATITVNNPPSGRTTITVTATTTAPDGNSVSGMVTTDIITGVTHVYTVAVAQLFAAPKK